MRFLNKSIQIKWVLFAILIIALFVAAREPLKANYYQTSAVAASGVVKTSDGYFFAISGYNNKGSTQFIQLFDSSTVPADTAVPKIVFEVDANKNFFFDTFDRGIYFANGISWSNSSTLATKTIGAADVMVTGVEYR